MAPLMAPGRFSQIAKDSNAWSLLAAYVEDKFGLYEDEVSKMTAEYNITIGDTVFCFDVQPHQISKRLLFLADRASRIIDSPVNLAVAAAAAPETTLLLKEMVTFIRERDRRRNMAPMFRARAEDVLKFHEERGTDLREFKSHL